MARRSEVLSVRTARKEHDVDRQQDWLASARPGHYGAVGSWRMLGCHCQIGVMTLMTLLPISSVTRVRSIKAQAS